MTDEFDDLLDDDWESLTTWVKEHAAVEVAPGVDLNDADPGV